LGVVPAETTVRDSAREREYRLFGVLYMDMRFENQMKMEKDGEL
jgi:hypothetical protein